MWWHWRKALQRMIDLADTQAVFDNHMTFVLKNCLGVSKINHPLQSLPPIPSHRLHVFDKHQRVFLKRITSCLLTDLQWQLALLPCGSNTQLPAYLASWIATWQIVADIAGPLLNTRKSHDLRKATDDCSEQSPDSDMEEHCDVEGGLQNVSAAT